MDFLTGNIKKIYVKYLFMSFWASLIVCVYSFVDTAMVGQYHGPSGTAALAAVSPFWSMMCSCGIFFGTGAAVLFGVLRGSHPDDRKRSNEYFTAGLLLSAIIGAVLWVIIGLWDRQLIVLCGAEGELIEIAHRYIVPLKFAVGAFPVEIYLNTFLRNDGNPTLATVSVITAGVINMVGDYVCVFALDMGAYGAGLATAIGQYCGLLVTLFHFKSKKNTLFLAKPHHFVKKCVWIAKNGFSAFILDLAPAVVTLLYNRQIMRFFGENALAVFGVIIYLHMFIICCAYSIGQAAQPIVSRNYGAAKADRIRSILKYCLITCAGVSLIWTAVCMAFPNTFIRIFMQPTAEVLELAPSLIRAYSWAYILLPLNVFSIYYFQSIMQSGISLMVALARDAVIASVLLIVLPLIFPPQILWYCVAMAEAVTAVYVIVCTVKYTKQL